MTTSGANAGSGAARRWDWERNLAAGLVILVFAIALASLILPFLTIAVAYEKTYNEGWNAYHATRVAAGEPLYSGDDWRLVNYPFLSFYLIAGLKPLFGDVLIIGRVLSFLALIAVGGLSALIVRRFGGRALEMLFAVACVIGFQQIQAAGWIATDEPQMLAEAFMLAGLFCHVSGRSNLRRLAGTALLLATGGFIKHILIAIPAAIAIDIWWNERRLLASWCTCLGAAIAFYIGLTYLIAGGDFFHELFVARYYHWDQLLYHPRKFLIALKIPFIASLVFLGRPLPADRAVLLRGYGIVAIGSATLFSAVDGVSYNVFLDVAVCMGILAALALQQWRAHLRLRPIGYVVAALLPALVASPILTRLSKSLGSLRNYREVEQSYEAKEAGFRQAAAFLRGHEGAALCESLLMCFEAGKPLVIDPFMAHSLMLVKRLDEAKLTRDIADHRFAIIELPAAIYESGRAGPIAPILLAPARFAINTLQAIDRHYKLAADSRNLGYAFYVPKPE
jgi:hypothetical protein